MHDNIAGDNGMKKAQRMEPVLTYARHMEHTAAHALKMESRKIQDQKDKIAQLKDYSREYGQTLAAIGEAGVNAYTVINYHNFQAKLLQLIDSHEQQLAKMSAHYQVLLAAWTKRSQNVKMYDQISDKYHRYELALKARTEQKDQDDLPKSGTEKFLR